MLKSGLEAKPYWHPPCDMGLGLRRCRVLARGKAPRNYGSALVVHSQMLGPLAGRKGIQPQVCPEKSEHEINSDTNELSPPGPKLLGPLRSFPTEMLRIHICPPLPGRRLCPQRCLGSHVACTTEDHTAIAVRGSTICPVGFMS